MTDSTASSDKSQTPPWGKDEDFDPARAWTLIQNLRTDLDEVKSERDTLKSDAQAREDAGKSEAEKLTGRLSETERNFKEAQRALFIERALRKHAIPDDLVDFLTGETEEEIVQKAERLASIGSAKAESGSEETPGETPNLDDAGKPKPALTPGHGGEEKPQFDPAAIAKAAR